MPNRRPVVGGGPCPRPAGRGCCGIGALARTVGLRGGGGDGRGDCGLGVLVLGVTLVVGGTGRCIGVEAAWGAGCVCDGGDQMGCGCCGLKYPVCIVGGRMIGLVDGPIGNPKGDIFLGDVAVAVCWSQLKKASCCSSDGGVCALSSGDGVS